MSQATITATSRTYRVMDALWRFGVVVSQEGCDDKHREADERGNIAIGAYLPPSIWGQMTQSVWSIAADMRAARAFIETWTNRLGARLDDPEVRMVVPVGHWCYADVKNGAVILRESPSALAPVVLA